MNKNIIIGLVVLILLIGGGVFVMNQQSLKQPMEKNEPDNAVMENTDAKVPNGKEGIVMDGNDAGNTVDQTTYTGTVIAGKTTPYIDFNQADYNKAMQSGKIIFLEFYATWCPICRAQAPKLAEGFDTLNDPNVVGFRVNYNDPETDDTEKKLAKDFGVTYQHTHVIVKDGNAVSKTNDQLDKESFIQLIESVK